MFLLVSLLDKEADCWPLLGKGWGLEDVGVCVVLEVPGSSPLIVVLLPGEKHLAFMQHTMGGVVREGWEIVNVS